MRKRTIVVMTVVLIIILAIFCGISAYLASDWNLTNLKAETSVLVTLAPDQITYIDENPNASSEAAPVTAEVTIIIRPYTDSLPPDNITPTAVLPPEENTCTPVPEGDDEAVTPVPERNDEAVTPVPFEVLAPTVLMSFEELLGDNGDYSFPKGFPSADTYKMILDEYYQVVLIYSKDEDGEYTVPVRYMLCSSGKNGGTPKGVYSMHSHRVRFDQFVNTDYYAQYWTQMAGNIYFHSVLYTAREASAYSETAYNNLGNAVSAGCVRLTVPDARWIFYNIAPGTCLIVREGDSDDEETAAIKEALKLAELPAERVVLTTGEAPYTDNWLAEEISIDVEFEQGTPWRRSGN